MPVKEVVFYVHRLTTMIVDQPARDEYVSVLSRRRNDLDEEEKSKRALARMEEKHLDLILVPLGLMVMSIYHLWLFIRIVRNPKGTVIGINAFARERWVKFMMTDPLKNGVLAVQTIRNNIMASTLLATTAITLSSLIGVVVSSTKDSSTAAILIYGNTSPLVSAIKYFTILLCFLVAFLFNVQSIRYYAHTSILISVAPPKELEGSVRYVVRSLNRGSFFWSLGLRSFYFSFPLFLWIFGPIPMFACSCVMCFLLYFLDTTSHFTQKLLEFLGREAEAMKLKENESRLPV